MDTTDEMRHEHELALARAKHDDEHFHELESWCIYKTGTGDPKWAIHCRKDNKWATRRQCDKCLEERHVRVE